jgi:hypothetical protein
VRAGLIVVVIAAGAGCRGESSTAAKAAPAGAPGDDRRVEERARQIVELAEARVAVAKARQEARLAPSQATPQVARRGPAHPLPSLAWVNPRAASGGGIADGIGGHRGSLSGAAAPLPRVELSEIRVDGQVDDDWLGSGLGVLLTSWVACRPPITAGRFEFDVDAGRLTLQALPAFGPSMSCMSEAILRAPIRDQTYHLVARLTVTAP